MPYFLYTTFHNMVGGTWYSRPDFMLVSSHVFISYYAAWSHMGSFNTKAASLCCTELYLQHTATLAVPHLGLCTSRLQVRLKSTVSTDTRCRFYSTTENDKYGLADAKIPDVYETTYFIKRVKYELVSRPGHRQTALNNNNNNNNTY
jgi:hypothetical protein